MYGEGYDWTPLYSVRSGQMVGALPVGIETKGFDDAPYWPTQICWTYKEVWTQPVGQWLWLMQDVAVPATVRGVANGTSHEPVEFHEQKTGQLITATANPIDGEFSIHLPEGHYEASQGSVHTSVTVLPGGLYRLDLRQDHAFDFNFSFQDTGHHEIVLRVSAQGIGAHTFTIRCDNLILREPATQKVDLIAGNSKETFWHARVVSSETPWVALVFPDGVVSERREVTSAELPHE
jgi:hypothetical protein